MDIELESVERLRLADGSPVRAASAVAPFGEGFLVVQDDAAHGAWFRGGSASAVRLLPAVDGHDVFDEASRTKQLKPDLEAACALDVEGVPALLMLLEPEPTRTRLLAVVDVDDPAVPSTALRLRVSR